MATRPGKHVAAVIRLGRGLRRGSSATCSKARTFGPDLNARGFTGYGVYIAGPLAGVVVA
jgi:hypothetical protein